MSNESCSYCRYGMMKKEYVLCCPPLAYWMENEVKAYTHQVPLDHIEFTAKSCELYRREK